MKLQKIAKTAFPTLSVLSTRRVKLVALVSCLCAFFLQPAFASAGSGTQALQRFFTDVKTLKADFIQTVQSEDFRKSETSSGKLMMLRPGHFRWDYEKPYLQKIIADGQKLWIFDIDLDQVIVKSLKNAVGNTPAVLLSGSAELSDQFKIKDVKNDDAAKNLDWVELLPKDEEAGFQSLRLGFANDLQLMILRDAFGQETRIQFSRLERNPNIDPNAFSFVPPPGVDVLSE